MNKLTMFPFLLFAGLAVAFYIAQGAPINWLLVLLAGIAGAALNRCA